MQTRRCTPRTTIASLLAALSLTACATAPVPSSIQPPSPPSSSLGSNSLASPASDARSPLAAETPFIGATHGPGATGTRGATPSELSTLPSSPSTPAPTSRPSSIWDVSQQLAEFGADTALTWSQGLGFLVAGQSSSGLALWRSDDGLNWSVSGPVPARRRASIRDFALLRGGVIAVGDVTSGGQQTFAERASTWTSPDGITWRRQDSPAFDRNRSVRVFGDRGGTALTNVEVTDAGLVAIGWDSCGTCEGQDPTAIWTSRDGSSWQRVHLNRKASGTMASFLASSRAGLLAYGGGTYLLSSDGRHWDVVAQPSLVSVIGTPDGYLAVGYSANNTQAILASRDGRRWRDVFDLDPLADWSSGLLLAVRGGYVAIAERTDVGSKDTGTVLATSADGTAWTEGAIDPALEFAAVSAATTDGNKVVLFGLNNGITGSVWVTDKLP
jgi:hypothetical protein